VPLCRRAQLRWCFERLKDVVPSPSGRHTTKGLLAGARHLIKVRIMTLDSSLNLLIIIAAMARELKIQPLLFANHTSESAGYILHS